MNPADEAAEQHAQTTYLPRPARQRSGVALALSGGGYRATVFHQGMLARLAESQLLDKVGFISTV